MRSRAPSVADASCGAAGRRWSRRGEEGDAVTSNARGAGGSRDGARARRERTNDAGNVRSAIRGCGNDEMRRGFDARPRGGSNGPAPAVETESGAKPPKKIHQQKGWSRQESNSQPSDLESDALPLCYRTARVVIFKWIGDSYNLVHRCRVLGLCMVLSFSNDRPREEEPEGEDSGFMNPKESIRFFVYSFLRSVLRVDSNHARVSESRDCATTVSHQSVAGTVDRWNWRFEGRPIFFE